MIAAALALVPLITGLGLGKDDRPLTEKQKIQALIKHLEGLKDAQFVRNGTEYDAQTAAKFLRRKWEAHEATIKTARDFIDQVANVSSTSGKPYRIRLKGGQDMKLGDYLAEQLKKLEKPGTGQR
jgi:hypothetical protein